MSDRTPKDPNDPYPEPFQMEWGRPGLDDIVLEFAHEISDTVALNLIESYCWAISPQDGGGWIIDGHTVPGQGGDAALTLACTRGSLRGAIKAALVNEQARYRRWLAKDQF